MKNRIRELREAEGWSQTRLGEMIGTSQAQIDRLEKNQRRLSDFWMPKFAAAFKCHTDDLFNDSISSKVPIIGEIGAGTEIFPVDHVPLMQQGMREKDQDYVNCEFVDAPPGVYPAGVVAVRVRGDSMLPFLSAGAIIYYEQRITGGCNDYLGSLIVAQIKDGPALLKTLRRGYAYGRFNLESYNAPLIEDVELEWCAKVAFIKPA